MKIREKEQAIILRQKYGMSIGKIAYKLGVSKSSVSVWVRDIMLTNKQKQKLRESNPIFNKSLNDSQNKIRKARQIRKMYQLEGKAKFDELVGQKKNLAIALCMLYWGEGSKSKTKCALSNSDVNLLKFFKRGLIEIFAVPTDKITIRINCHTDIHSLKEIENFWLHQLELPKTCLRKSTVNNYSKSSQKKRKGKLEWGVCLIVVCSVVLVQQIYGIIQEFAGFKNKKWLK